MTRYFIEDEYGNLERIATPQEWVIKLQTMPADRFTLNTTPIPDWEVDASVVTVFTGKSSQDFALPTGVYETRVYMIIDGQRKIRTRVESASRKSALQMHDMVVRQTRDLRDRTKQEAKEKLAQQERDRQAAIRQEAERQKREAEEIERAARAEAKRRLIKERADELVRIEREKNAPPPVPLKPRRKIQFDS